MDRYDAVTNQKIGVKCRHWRRTAGGRRMLLLLQKGRNTLKRGKYSFFIASCFSCHRCLRRCRCPTLPVNNEDSFYPCAQRVEKIWSLWRLTINYVAAARRKTSEKKWRGRASGCNKGNHLLFGQFCHHRFRRPIRSVWTLFLSLGTLHFISWWRGGVLLLVLLRNFVPQHIGSLWVGGMCVIFWLFNFSHFRVKLDSGEGVEGWRKIAICWSLSVFYSTLRYFFFRHLNWRSGGGGDF